MPSQPYQSCLIWLTDSKRPIFLPFWAQIYLGAGYLQCKSKGCKKGFAFSSGVLLGPMRHLYIERPPLQGTYLKGRSERPNEAATPLHFWSAKLTPKARSSVKRGGAKHAVVEDLLPGFFGSCVQCAKNNADCVENAAKIRGCLFHTHFTLSSL